MLNLKITNEVTGFSHGQMDGYILAHLPKDGYSEYLGQELIGKIQYAEFQGEVHVQWIQTRDDYKRQGVATQMIEFLKKEFPDAKIHSGMTTDNGTPFFESLKKRNILSSSNWYTKYAQNTLDDLFKKENRHKKVEKHIICTKNILVSPGMIKLDNSAELP